MPHPVGAEPAEGFLGTLLAVELAGSGVDGRRGIPMADVYDGGGGTSSCWLLYL